MHEITLPRLALVVAATSALAIVVLVRPVPVALKISPYADSPTATQLAMVPASATERESLEPAEHVDSPAVIESETPRSAFPRLQEQIPSLAPSLMTTAPNRSSINSAISSIAPPATNLSLPPPTDVTTEFPITLPLAFADAALNASNLAPEEVARVDQIRDEFTKQIGSQNIYDPAYLERWQQAHADSDDLLRATLGWAAFNSLTIAAAQNQ